MCNSAFFDPGKQARKAAKRAEAQEAERQRLSKEGVARVGEAFAGFDDNFFKNKYYDPAKQFYTSEVSNQAEDARRALLATVAGRGLSGSSVELKELDRFNQRQSSALASALDRAEQTEGAARARVEDNRGQLENFALSAADPATAATRAQSQANILVAANPAFDPVGNVFEGFSPLIGAQIRGRNEGRDNAATRIFGPPKSSARIVT